MCFVFVVILFFVGACVSGTSSFESGRTDGNWNIKDVSHLV